MVFNLPHGSTEFEAGDPNVGAYVWENDNAISDYLNSLLSTTPGFSGASLIGVEEDGFVNFNPNDDTVAGALEAIDGALGTLGIDVFTDGIVNTCPNVAYAENFTANGGADTFIDTLSYKIQNATYSKSIETISHSTTDPTDDRVDLVYITEDGAYTKIEGAFSAANPVIPFDSMPIGADPLYLAYITSTAGNDPAIVQTDIYSLARGQGILTCQSGAETMVDNGAFFAIDGGVGLDDDFHLWTVTKDGTVTGLIKAEYTDYIFGINSASISLVSATAAGAVSLTQNASLVAGIPYSLSAFIKNSGCGCNTKMFIGIEYTWQGNVYETNIIGCDTTHGLLNCAGVAVDDYADNKWTRHCGVVVVPKGSTSVKYKAYLYADTSPATAQILIDGFKAECGCSCSCLESFSQDAQTYTPGTWVSSGGRYLTWMVTAGVLGTGGVNATASLDINFETGITNNFITTGAGGGSNGGAELMGTIPYPAVTGIVTQLDIGRQRYEGSGGDQDHGDHYITFELVDPLGGTTQIYQWTITDGTTSSKTNPAISLTGLQIPIIHGGGYYTRCRVKSEERASAPGDGRTALESLVIYYRGAGLYKDHLTNS